MERLLKAGLSRSDIDTLNRAHGDGTASLADQALGVGLSKELILEMLELTGKLGLELLFELKKQQATAAVIIGDRVEDVVTPPVVREKNLIDTLLEKFLPIIMEKLVQRLLTDENIERLIKLITDFLFSRIGSRA